MERRTFSTQAINSPLFESESIQGFKTRFLKKNCIHLPLECVPANHLIGQGCEGTYAGDNFSILARISLEYFLIRLLEIIKKNLTYLK